MNGVYFSELTDIANVTLKLMPFIFSPRAHFPRPSFDKRRAAAFSAYSVLQQSLPSLPVCLPTGVHKVRIVDLKSIPPFPSSDECADCNQRGGCYASPKIFSRGINKILSMQHTLSSGAILFTDLSTIAKYDTDASYTKQYCNL